jgi:3-oxoacyl-[acyl-carrier protein] reductase
MNAWRVSKLGSRQRQVDAVVFDFGGVLTFPVRESINAWLAADGVNPTSFSRTLKAWLSRDAADGTPIHRLETGELSVQDFEVQLAAALTTVDGRPIEPVAVLSRLFAEMRLDPEMFRLVDDLRAAGLRLALLSNSWGNTYPRKRIDALFDPIVISAEVGLRKPLAPIYELTLERLGIPAERTLFLDDAEPNLIGARKVGMQALLHIDAASTRSALAALIPELTPYTDRSHPMTTSVPTPSAHNPTRTAVVTGAARGIGAEVAKRLAADGLAVAVLDLDEAACKSVAAQIEGAGGHGLAVSVDVADEAAVQTAVEQIARDLGEPTVLVNNAGIIRDNLLFRMSADDWDAVMNVHLRGSFLMARAVQGFMTNAGWGRIVNLSSTSALGNRGQVNYSAAKAGLQGFTKTLALELGRFGVTANAIAPGFIETEMTAATAQRIGVAFEDFKAGAAGEIPVGRIGTPADIAHVVSFFASEGAGFVSGQVLYVAGGPKA